MYAALAIIMQQCYCMIPNGQDLVVPEHRLLPVI
jgi:hypothetical protein